MNKFSFTIKLLTTPNNNERKNQILFYTHLGMIHRPLVHPVDRPLLPLGLVPPGRRVVRRPDVAQLPGDAARAHVRCRRCSCRRRRCRRPTRLLHARHNHLLVVGADASGGASLAGE